MNPLAQLLQNPQMLFKRVNDFAQKFQQQSNGVTPQQMVQNLLNQGKMSQAEFNQYRDMVNRITSMHY